MVFSLNLYTQIIYYETSTPICDSFLLFFSCVETDYKNDRVDPEIFISNPLSTLEEGTDYQLETKYFNYVGKEIENPVVNWSTENPTILTVSETGLVTGISMGVAIITASLITKEENLTITNTNKITVSMSTAVEPVKFDGTITSTSSYLLKGSYTLEPLDAGGGETFPWRGLRSRHKSTRTLYIPWE